MFTSNFSGFTDLCRGSPLSLLDYQYIGWPWVDNNASVSASAGKSPWLGWAPASERALRIRSGEQNWGPHWEKCRWSSHVRVGMIIENSHCRDEHRSMSMCPLEEVERKVASWWRHVHGPGGQSRRLYLGSHRTANEPWKL